MILVASATQRRQQESKVDLQHCDEQQPEHVVQLQDQCNKPVSEVDGGYGTKSSNIPQQPKVQTGVVPHHPCSMGVQLQRHGRKWRRSTLQASKGSGQRILLKGPSVAQAMQWPLEKHLMTTQSVPHPLQHQQHRIRALLDLWLGA
jgi:hypothetical protein